MKHRRLTNLVLLTIALAALVLHAPASAAGPSQQTPESNRSIWSVQPANESEPDGRPNFTYDLDPGDEVTDYFSVRNLGNSPLDLRIYATDAFTNGSGGFDLLQGNETPVDVGSWVSVDISEITIQPDQVTIIPFTLTVPEDALPGDHAGGIVATLTTADEDGPGNQVRVEYRVGSRIYLQVSGEIVPGLQIEDLSMSQDWSWNPFVGRDVQVNYTLRNTGNVRMTAQSDLEINGIFGVELRKIELEQTPEILPGDSFTGEVTLRRVAPAVRLNGELLLDASIASTATAESSPIAQISRAAAAWSLPISQGVEIVWILLSAYLLWRIRAGRKAAIARTFAPESVAAMIEQLNEADDGRALAICRGVTRQPGITEARIAGLDPDGVTFLATAEEELVTVRERWRKQVVKPDHIERELERMARDARQSSSIFGGIREGQAD